MAIRVGSEGLKYPLPSYAEIGARQSAAAASAGATTTAAAYTANRRHAGLKLQLRHEAEQAAINRQFQAEQAANKPGRVTVRSDNSPQIEAQQDEQQFQNQQALLQERGEQDLDQSILQGVRRGELELPEAAQRQMRQLDAAGVDALQLDPGQQLDFAAQRNVMQRDLLRLAQPRRSSPAQDLRRSTAFVDPQGGMYDEAGEGRIPFNVRTGKPLFEQKDPAAEAEQQFNSSVMKRYEKNLTETDLYNKPLYGDTEGKVDENAALQAAIDQQNSVERGRQRLLGGAAKAEGASGQPAVPEQARQYRPDPSGSGVQVTDDGGKTWTPYRRDAATSAPPQQTAVDQVIQQMGGEAAPQRTTTEEEGSQLPPGTVYVAPDGTVRRRAKQ